jgi:hypothetical protein
MADASENEKPPPPQPPELISPVELVERLTLENGALVEKIDRVVATAIDAGTKREATLDAKANSLLTAVGLSLTVAFTFGGGMLFGAQKPFASLSPAAYKAVVITYCIALLFGLLAGAAALGAMFIRSYRGADEQDLFNPKLLKRANEPGKEALYVRTMIAHVWQLHQFNSRVLQRRAKVILLGQVFFGLFLTTVIVLGAFTGYSANLALVTPPR